MTSRTMAGRLLNAVLFTAGFVLLGLLVGGVDRMIQYATGGNWFFWMIVVVLFATAWQASGRRARR